jgi:monothiol glutaredoxin
LGKHLGSQARYCAAKYHRLMRCAGIKEYSEWPTIPQLYVDKEFVGGCDILMSMHQDGSLAKMLEEKGVVVPADAEQKP